MKRKTWYLISSVAIVIILAIGFKKVFQKSELSVASKKAEIKITSSGLLAQYENNEESSNKLYLNKIIEVSGIVNEIKIDTANVSVYLKNSEDISGVLCGFNLSEIDTGEIHEGDNVKIKGICTGYLLDVVLNKCSLDE